MRNYYIFTGTLGLIVVIVLFLGFIIVGTPISEKAKALDRQRIDDFLAIQDEIDFYYENNNKLPEKLSDLQTTINLTDPETKQLYEYKTNSNISYSLCTQFSTDTTKPVQNPYDPEYRNYYYSGDEKHKKGYDCISFTVLNSSYPPQPPRAPKPITLYPPPLTPTPTPIIPSPQNYSQLKNCNLVLDPPTTSELKIMGLYELEDSLLFTTNKFVNATVEYWWQTPKSFSATYMYAASIFDTKKNVSNPTIIPEFRKVMGYRIKIYDATGKSSTSEDYYFEGQRTIIPDPRCIPTNSPTPQ